MTTAFLDDGDDKFNFVNGSGFCPQTVLFIFFEGMSLVGADPFFIYSLLYIMDVHFAILGFMIPRLYPHGKVEILPANRQLRRYLHKKYKKSFHIMFGVSICADLKQKFHLR